MVLESIFQVVVQTSMFVGGTVVATTMLSENAFDPKSPRAWWHQWELLTKDKNHPLNKPFHFPIWVALICHIVVAALFEVGFFMLYHNHGANDGLDIHPLPMLAAIVSYLLYTAWVLAFLALKGDCNILFMQLLSMFFLVSAMILAFGIHGLTSSGFWFVPFLAWQGLLTVKIALENFHRAH